MKNNNIINTRRIELGLTMKQLADAVGVSESTISRWESGEIVNIRKDKLPALSTALRVPIVKLVGFGDYPFAVGKSIEEVCVKKQITIKSLADASGVPVSEIEALIANEYEPITIETATKLSKALDVSISTLLKYNTNLLSAEWNEAMAQSDSDAIAKAFARRTIPVYGRVAAGIPIEAIENIIDFEEIPDAWPGEYAALKVKGDSMVPRIMEGDVLIVKIQDDAESGDVVVAIVNGEDATVKKLIKQGDGIVLQPLNTAYEPMYFSKSNVETIPVKIWGKVVENRQKF